MNWVEFAKAAAMPLAIAISAVCLLVAVIIVAVRKPEFTFKIKDWFEFGSRPHPKQPLTDPPGDERGAIATVVHAEQIGSLDASVETEDMKATAKQESASYFLDATDLNALETLFADFKSTDGFQQDVEFWETLFEERKAKFSDVDIIRAMEALAAKHPDWSWPLILMSRRKVLLSDVGGARETLAQAVKKTASRCRRYALVESIRFMNRFDGKQAAYSFLYEHVVKNPGSDAEIGGMLIEMSSILKKPDDLYSSAMIDEMAIRYDDGSDYKRFHLAYAMAEVRDLKTIAYGHYEDINGDSYYAANALNNQGVVLNGAGLTGAQFRKYYLSRKKDSDAAISNIANALTETKMVDLSREILDASEALNDGEGLIAGARKKLAEAEAEVTKELATFDRFALEQYAHYTAAVRGAFAYWRRTGDQVITGRYRAGDLVQIDADGAQATCRASIGALQLEGSLSAKELCYEGILSEDGKTLVTGESRRVLITGTEDGRAYCLIWPKNVTSEPFTAMHLERDL